METQSANFKLFETKYIVYILYYIEAFNYQIYHHYIYIYIHVYTCIISGQIWWEASVSTPFVGLSLAQMNKRAGEIHRIWPKKVKRRAEKRRENKRK